MTVQAIVDAKTATYSRRVYTKRECLETARSFEDATRKARKAVAKHLHDGDSVRAEQMRVQADAYERQASEWRKRAETAPNG